MGVNGNGSEAAWLAARGRSSKWLWLSTAAIWTGFGVFDATQTVFVMRSGGMHHNWARLFVTLLIWPAPSVPGATYIIVTPPAEVSRG